MQAVMVFYGLAVALIAVSVWQTYTDAGATTSEATAIGVLYRYGRLSRAAALGTRKNCVNTQVVIKEAWPLQHQLARCRVEEWSGRTMLGRSCLPLNPQPKAETFARRNRFGPTAS